jgi:hypothetical protein
VRSRDARKHEARCWGRWMLVAVAGLLILYMLVEGSPNPWIGAVTPLITVTATLSGVSLGSRPAYQQRREEENQRRRTLATLLLSELQLLEQTLRAIRLQADPGGNTAVAPFQTAVYSGAGVNLLLFMPETVHAPTFFYRQLHALRETLTDLVGLVHITGHPFPAGDTAVHWKVRWRAASAAHALKDVAQRLSAAGGQWPRALPIMPTHSLDLPDWPPPAFEHSSL